MATETKKNDSKINSDVSALLKVMSPKADFMETTSSRGPTGPVSDWNPTKPDEKLLGVYAGYEVNGRRNIYGIAVLKGLDGKPGILRICGPHALKKLRHIPVGTTVRLTYRGMKKLQGDEGRQSQDILVEHAQ